MNIQTTFIDRMRDSLRDLPVWRIWPMPLLELLLIVGCLEFADRSMQGEGILVTLFLLSLTLVTGLSYALGSGWRLVLPRSRIELRLVSPVAKIMAAGLVIFYCRSLADMPNADPQQIILVVTASLAGFLFHAWWAPQFEARRPRP